MAESLPSVRWAWNYPQLVDSVSVSRTGNRAISFVEYADPFWQVTMTTQKTTATERNLLEAFIGRAKRGMVTVLYTPTHQCIPREYWGDANNPALANDGVLTAIVDGNKLSFNSVDASLKLREGDLIGLTSGDYKLIVRVLQNQDAVAGAFTSLMVEPPIPSYITTGAAVTFKNPQMNMRVLPSSFQVPDEHRPVGSFVMVEVPK